MAFEIVKLYREIEFDLSASAPATLQVYAEQPGGSMVLRFTAQIPATLRRPVSFKLPGTLKGKQLIVEITPGFGVLALYGGRVNAKELKPGGDWGWYPLPVLPTPAGEWIPVKLPIEATPESWSPVKLPIEPTPENWSSVQLPIPPTPEEYSAVKLQIRPTAERTEWVDLPMDQ